MTVVHIGNNFYQGLAADTKPTNVPENSRFYETDTFTTFYRVSGAWKELTPLDNHAEYIIYRASSSLYKAKNLTTGIVDYSNSTPDASALTTSVLGNIAFLGGKIIYSNDPFTFHSKITLTGDTGFQARPWVFEGMTAPNSPVIGTNFAIGSSFPDGNFLFESVNAGASGLCTAAEFRNINFRNPLAKTTSAGVNVAGGATAIDAGFINIENDTQTSAGAQVKIENCNFQYGWKSIRLAGQLWWAKLENLGFSDANIEFVGDYDLQLENGSGHDAEDGRPKGYHIKNIRVLHAAGNSGGGGALDNSVVLCGGYHHAYDIFIDGIKYNDSAFALKQCFSSTIHGLQTIDLVTTGSTVAAIVLDSVSPDGVAASANYATFNNQLYDVAAQDMTGTAKSITFLNSPFRNWIRAYGYYGGIIDINDTSAGIENIIELIPGHQPTATANTKAVQTASNVKIIDRRPGASGRGISTQSGDGSDKVFEIPHGLFGTPVDYDVRPITADAFGAYSLSVDATNITITYVIAPPNGSSNLKWKWVAELYSN